MIGLRRDSRPSRRGAETQCPLVQRSHGQANSFAKGIAYGNHYRHSTAFLSVFFALTFTFYGFSALAQTKSRSYGGKTAFIISKIDTAVAREFQEAWHVSRNGSGGFEGLVLVYPATDGSILARSQGKSDEQKQFTFGWTSNIFAVVHTHPNDVDPRPVGDDLRLADRFGVPVFTITRRGMYVCMTPTPGRPAWCRMGSVGSIHRR